MKGKISGTTVAAGLIIMLAVGLAAAAITLPHTETVQVNNNTTEIETTVQNIHDPVNTTDTNATITLYGVYDGGSQTAVDSKDLIGTESNTTFYAYGGGENETVNATKFAEYEIEIEGETKNTEIDDVSIKKIETTGGGGALVPSGWGLDAIPTEAGVGAILVVALLGAAWRAN